MKLDAIARQVLIVEDEPLLALLLEEMLTEQGYRIVATASRFDDAMEKARSMSFDVAILDMNLGGTTTFPIAEVLLTKGKRFVFATGYGAPSIPPSLKQIPVIQKPFQENQLIEAIASALQ
jgi:CheY-like chemotaxis protein